MSHSKLPSNTLKKSRNTIFNDIAKSSKFRGLNWLDPDSWRPLEEEYISRSKLEAKSKPKDGEIPQWALEGNWMDSYPEIIQWMRKEHWRNNRTKLKEIFNQGVSQEPSASGEITLTNSSKDKAGDAGDVGDVGDVGDTESWQAVMLQP